VVRNLSPGRYIVNLQGGAYERDFYIKSMRSGKVDVFRDGLIVTDSGAPPLKIVLSSGGGSMEGVVLDEDKQPVEGASVLLVPDPARREREDLFKSGTTDQFGRYRFQAIAPGDYKLFAWEDVEPEAWHDPQFLKEFEKHGEPVTVRPNAHVTSELRLISDREE